MFFVNSVFRLLTGSVCTGSWENKETRKAAPCFVYPESLEVDPDLPLVSYPFYSSLPSNLVLSTSENGVQSEVWGGLTSTATGSGGLILLQDMCIQFYGKANTGMVFDT